MKSTKLIAMIKGLDPDGIADVTIGNFDIYSVYKDGAFAGGCMERLVYDPETDELIGAEILSDGHKIVLTELPIESALVIKPDLPIKLSVHGNAMLAHYMEQIEKWRGLARGLHDRLRGEQ